MRRFSDDQAFLAQWRAVLDERVNQAATLLANVEGVCGLVLGGSLGRGTPWPLSDIDILPVYEDGDADAATEVAQWRLTLLEKWEAEGFRTALDVGNLAFTRSEIARTLVDELEQMLPYLGDERWFHGLDKGYGGKAVFDPDGLTGRFVMWITAARFANVVVRERRRCWRYQIEKYRAQAACHLSNRNGLATALAMRKGAAAMTSYFMESWGERDSSWARLGSRFERVATKRGMTMIAHQIMALHQLAPEDVFHRMRLAPEYVRVRHRLSFQARQLVKEPITVEQDARDVLLVFGSKAIRNADPPYDPWLGLETDPSFLASQLDSYDCVVSTVLKD